jgi:hypothetical protein
MLTGSAGGRQVAERRWNETIKIDVPQQSDRVGGILTLEVGKWPARA